MALHPKIPGIVLQLHDSGTLSGRGSFEQRSACTVKDNHRTNLMKKLLTATVALFALSINADLPSGAGGAQKDEISAPYYKQTLQVELTRLIKAVGLETNLLTGGAIRLGNRFDYPEVVGAGVLAPDDGDQLLPFSPMAKLNQAVRRFLQSKGVDFSHNSALVMSESGLLHVEGSLEHLLLVRSIMGQFAPPETSPVRKAAPLD